MGIPSVAGLLALIPTTLFLTLSFFVLLAVEKIDKKGLKIFGWIIAILLWISAILIFLGIYSAATANLH